jgi:outer membrane receptor protein involved in Fe transport
MIRRSIAPRSVQPIMKRLSMIYFSRITFMLGLGLALVSAFPAHAATDPVEPNLDALTQTPLISDSKYDLKQSTAAKYEQMQKEVAASVSVITRDEIKAYGWRTLGQALASLPGIHTTYDRQYTYLGTRGFGLPGDYNTRVMVAINGNRINPPHYDSGMIGSEFPLDVDLIERIEYIAGPGGAVYGQNAMFGVINVITRSGAKMDGGELAAAWQSPQSMREGRISWGKLLDNGVDLLLSASGMRAEGEDLLMDFPGADDYGFPTSGVAAGLDAERDQEFFARVGRGPWALDFIYSDRRKNDPTAMFFTDPLAPGQYERDEYVLTQLHYQDDFAGNTLNVLGRLFLGQERWSGLYTYSYYGGQNYSTGTSDWYGGEVRLLYTGITNHKLMLGLELQDNTRIDMSNDVLTTAGLEAEVLGSGYRAGIYAQDEWRLSDTWSTTLGLRVDDNDVTGTELSPRAALIWQATPATTVKALYGRAFRPPNAYERDYAAVGMQASNPSLEGESIDTLELVVDHRMVHDLNLRGSIYRWTIHDLVSLGSVPVSNVPQYQTGGDATASGAELSADKTWDSGARLRASVSYQDVAYASGDDLLNSPNWLGKLNYSTPLPWAGLRLAYEFQYDAQRLSKNGSDLDGYSLSNLNLIADKWAKGLEVSLGIRNLFDQDYQHPGSRGNWQNALEQDGGSTRVKLEYRF